MIKRPRFFRFSMRAALVALVLVAVAIPVHANTFKWAFQSDAGSMDPYTMNNTMTLGFTANIYEGLVRHAKDESIEPALAVSWEVVQADMWKFNLRKGVTFHDGSPFTADDVIFSFERVNSKGSDLKAFVAGIKEIKKVDDHTIEIYTNGPWPLLLNDMFRWYIMPEKWCEENDSAVVAGFTSGTEETFATRHANGTGPFMLKSREPQVKTVLVPNPKWWDKREDNITEAIFTPIKSDATRIASLLSGELDMIYPVPIQDVERVKKTKGFKSIQGMEVRTVFLGFDTSRDELLYSDVKGKNPLQDVRVRKAMYQAIDMEAIKKKIMRGASWPAGLMIGSNINGFNEKLNERFPYDPEASKKLLAEAGYPDGFSIVLDTPNDRYVNDEAISQAVAAMLTKVGINCKLNAQTRSKHFAKIASLDTSFYLLGWAPMSFDVHNTYYSNAMTNGQTIDNPLPGQGNWNCGNYSNPEIDKLLVEMTSEIDTDKRQAIIDKMMSIHKEDVGHIPLHQQALSWGTSDAVDLHQSADNTLSLRWVVKK